MPVQPKKKRAPSLHPTVTGEPQRAVPSLNAAWNWMAEEDKRAIEEIVARYTEIAERSS